MEQALRFRFRNLLDGNAGPHGNDVGNVVFSHDEFFIVMLLLFLLEGRNFRSDFFAGIAQGGAFFKVFPIEGCFFFLLDIGQLLFQDLQFMRRRIDFHADPCRRFVHDVDSLIGQVAVGNIAGRQFDGSPYGFVGDTGLVEGFVPIAQAEEDGYGIFFIRFTDLDGLETPSQGGIFFKMLLIFVSRRRPDALQIAAGQGRFQDIGGIHSAFYGTGADELMDFIDEEDDRIVAGNGI